MARNRDVLLELVRRLPEIAKILTTIDPLNDIAKTQSLLF
jgi:hypothetical protein